MENLSRENLQECVGGCIAIIYLANKVMTALGKLANMIKSYGRIA